MNGFLPQELLAEHGFVEPEKQEPLPTRERRGLTITRVRHHEDGHWCAVVTMDGQQALVDKKHGSWRVTPDVEADGFHDVLPMIAQALQDRVVPLEAAERRAREDAQKAAENAKPLPEGVAVG